MKEFRTTIVLLVAAALLGGWVFWRERGPKKEGFTPFSIQPDDAKELEIANELSNEPLLLRREGKTWWLVKPLRARADQDLLKTTLDQLKDFTATADVTEDLKGRDLSEYHLKGNPRATLTVRTASGQEHTLRFGDKTIDDQSVYTQLADNRIVLVRANLFNDINTRKADGFRDKKLFALDYDKIERIALNYPDQVLEMERKAIREWQLTKPIKTVADFNAVDALITKLQTLVAAKFIEEEPKDLSKYGLDPPQLRVDVWVKGRKEPYEVMIGKDGKGADLNHVYAMTNVAKPVVGLADYLVKDLKQDLKTLRGKTVLSFIPNDVKRLALTYEGQQPIQVEKAKEETTPEWELRQPVEGPADRQTVENVLFSLNGQTAKDFIDNPSSLADYGLEPPQVEVALWLKDAADAKRPTEPNYTVRIGKAVKTAKEESVFVQVKGQDTVYKVAGARWLEQVKVTLAQLRDKQILRVLDTAEVEKFFLRTKRKVLEVQRKDVNSWEIVQPERAEADSAKVNALLDTLTDLRGEAFVESFSSDPKKADLKKYGLDDPEVSVEIIRRDKATNKRQGAYLYVSRENDKGQVYVIRLRYQPAVYLAKGDLLITLRQDEKDLKK